MDIVNVILLILLYIVLMGLALWFVFKSPFNVIFLLVLLNSVFYLTPALAYILNKRDLFTYAYEMLGYFIDYNSYNMFLLILSINYLLLIGGIIAEKTYRSKLTNEKESNNYIVKKRSSYIFILMSSFFIWLLVGIYFYVSSNLSIIEFLSPSAKYDVFDSYYIKSLYIYLPLLIFTLSYIKNFRFTKTSLFWLSISILTSLSTGQRRDIIILVLFVIAITHFLNKKEKESDSSSYNFKLRLKLIISASFTMVIVPMLWWIRNYLTQQAKGGAVIAPWENRGFFELLFGSSSTGFPTLMFIDNMNKYISDNFMYSFKYILSIPIPRAIWSDKPVNPDVILQDYYGLDTNPSLFFLNELYFNFSYLSIPIAFIIGYFMTVFLKKLMTGFYGKILIIILFSNVITLFKNGFSNYLINVGFLSVIILSGVFFAFKILKVDNSKNIVK